MYCCNCLAHLELRPCLQLLNVKRLSWMSCFNCFENLFDKKYLSCSVSIKMWHKNNYNYNQWLQADFDEAIWSYYQLLFHPRCVIFLMRLVWLLKDCSAVAAKKRIFVENIRSTWQIQKGPKAIQVDRHFIFELAKFSQNEWQPKIFAAKIFVFEAWKCIIRRD